MSKQTKASETALTTALMRALACYCEDDIPGLTYKDHLAKSFLPQEQRKKLDESLYRNAVKSKARNGLFEYIIARTAYFDELYLQGLAENIPQIVILGAGYDTRAYRYQTKDYTGKVFEIDAPLTQKNKIHRLEENEIPHKHVNFVPVDFEIEDLMEGLTRHKYDKNQPTLWLWEGVTLYLTSEAVTKTIKDIISTEGKSTVGFDFLASQPGGEELIQRKDEKVLFGLEPLQMVSFLKEIGFNNVMVMDWQEMNQHYLTYENGEIFGSIKKTMAFVNAS